MKNQTTTRGKAATKKDPMDRSLVQLPAKEIKEMRNSLSGADIQKISDTLTKVEEPLTVEDGTAICLDILSKMSPENGNKVMGNLIRFTDERLSRDFDKANADFKKAQTAGAQFVSIVSNLGKDKPSVDGDFKNNQG